MLTSLPGAECPEGYWPAAKPEDFVVASDRPEFVPIYHQLWEELHTCKTPTQEWWDSFVKRIPCGYCRRHALDYAKKHTPPSDELAFFWWTVDFHNAVNVGKKKPTPRMEPDEARRRWRPHLEPDAA